MEPMQTMNNNKKSLEKRLKDELAHTKRMLWATLLHVPEWCWCNAELGQLPTLCPPRRLVIVFLLCRATAKRSVEPLETHKGKINTHLENPETVKLKRKRETGLEQVHKQKTTRNLEKQNDLRAIEITIQTHDTTLKLRNTNKPGRSLGNWSNPAILENWRGIV